MKFLWTKLNSVFVPNLKKSVTFNSLWTLEVTDEELIKELKAIWVKCEEVKKEVKKKLKKKLIKLLKNN